MEDLDDDFGDLYADVVVQASSAMQNELKNVENCSYNEFSMEPKSGILETNGIGNCGDNEFSDEPERGILGNNGSSALSSVDELAEEEEEEEGDGEGVVKKGGVLAEEDEVEGEEGGDEEGDVVEKVGEEEGDDEDTGSDSEDELNIVLNDDDDYDDGELGKNGVANDNVNKNEFIMSDHVSRRGWFDYNVNEEVDPCKDPAGLNFGGGRIGSGYNLQYKNMRFQPPAFPSESRANGSLSVASYSFKSVQDELKDDGYAHNLNTSSSASRRGDNFSLPRSRTILDVDIDSLNDKPWRHPGADITDFFNFGFDENSWKQYCDLLNTSRDQMSGNRYSCKPFGQNKELKVGTEHEDESQKVGLERLPNSVQLESGMISGRAIQVEESVTERQPSINRWGPLDRDSDVVIQINIQDDLKEDCLNSAKEDVDQTGVEYEDTILDESRELLCFSSATEDELSSVEGDDERSGNSVLESGKSCKHSPTSGSVSKHLGIDHESGQIVDDDVFGGKRTDAVPIEDEMNTSIESGRSDERRLSDAAPSLLKPHLNHGDQSPHSVTPPDSPSHRDYGYDTYAGYRKSNNNSKLNSPNSLPGVRDSVLYDCYLSEDSKKYGGRSKPRDREICSSSRSVLQPDLIYHGNKHIHVDGDGSDFSAKEWFSDSRHSTIYQKHNGLDSYDSKKNSFSKTSNSFPDYGDRDHKLPTYNVRDRYMKRLNLKGSRSGYDLGLNNRAIMNGKKRHFEPKSMLEHEEGSKGRFFDERRHDQQYMESPPHGGFRSWHSKSDSYLENEGGNQWRSGKHDWQYSKELEVDDLLVQSNYESRLTQGDHRYSMSSSVGVRDSVWHKGDKHLSRRKVESTAWSSRRRDGAYNGLEDVEYVEYVDDKGLCTRFASRDLQNLPHSTSRQRSQGGSSPRDCIDQSHSRNRRNVTFAERSYHNDHLGHYSSFDADTNVTMRNVDNQDCYERKWEHEQYGESRWSDEHYKFEKESEVLPGGLCYPYKRDPIHKNIDPQHGPNLSGNHINHIQAGRGRFKKTRGHKRGQVLQNPRFIRNDNYENKLPRFRSSVDSQLVGVDRKCTGRSFGGRNVGNARYEYIDDNHGTKLKIFDDAGVDYPSKGNHRGNFDIDARQKVGKRPKFSRVEHNEFLDIEEGQVLTEDLKEKAKAEMNSFEDLRHIGKKKNMYHENTTDVNEAFKEQKNTTVANKALKGHENATAGNEASKGHENPKKMEEILAKMEMRRERFKQPIALKKDTEKAAPMVVDTDIETCNSNLQRPARKRRWNGTPIMLSNA